MRIARHVDIGNLTAHLGQPSRPDLSRVRSLVSGVTSGSDAWARLTAILPPPLVEDSQRRFAMIDTSRGSSNIHEDLELFETPSTVEAAIAIASDASAVLEAEDIVRVLREQLTPWGAHKVSRIEWVVLSHQIKFGYRCGPAFQCAIETLEYALEEIEVTLDELQATPSWLPQMVRRTICANEGWTLAAQNELRISRAMNAPAAIVNTEFSSLQNPFGTVLQLWAKGYVLDHAREFEYPAARLFTLTVDAPPNLAQQIIERSKLNS